MRLFVCTDYSGELGFKNPWETKPLWIRYNKLQSIEKGGWLEVNIYKAINHGMEFLDNLRQS